MITIPTLWASLRMTPALYWKEITLGLLGLVGVGIGIFWWQTREVRPDKIEIISKSVTEVAIDVEGAVLHPGVYVLPAGLRVVDAIASAGGLTDKSDTKWVESNLNRAERIKDGMKVFIPAIEANFGSSAEIPITASSKISLNRASESELEALPGIGPVTAKKIISGRPYTDLNELTGRKIVGSKVFDQIKDLIVVW